VNFFPDESTNLFAEPGERDNKGEEERGTETRADHGGRQEQERAMNHNQDNGNLN